MSTDTPKAEPPAALPPATTQAMHPFALGAGALALVGASVLATLVFTHQLSPAPAPPAEVAERAHEHGESHHVELTPEALENAHLELATAEQGIVWTTVTMPGEVSLDGDRVVHVTPRISGTVREVKAQLGDTVKKGDLLAVLESRELAELSREARATSERRKLAQANFDRLESLYQQGIIAQKEELAAKNDLEEAKIAEEAAAQMLQAAGTGGGGATYPLKASIDGRIIEKHLTNGEVLKDDTLAFVIADLSNVWVDLSVYAKDLPSVAVGQSVRIRAEGIEQPVDGKIAFIGATANSEARTTMARVVLSNLSEKWRAGLFVTADVALAEHQVEVVVDEAAVQTVEGKPIVFVETPHGFDAREVKLGHIGRSKAGASVVEIASGVEKGARYVSKNAFVLKADLGKGEASHEH